MHPTRWVRDFLAVLAARQPVLVQPLVRLLTHPRLLPVVLRVFPDKSVTKKPAETRMGRGKGNPELWVTVIKPGRILFELEGVDEKNAREAMRLAAYKLPVLTNFVARDKATVEA